MTCQRALCAESEDKGEPATDQRADEKVPLAPDNGKNPDSASKDQK